MPKLANPSEGAGGLTQAEKDAATAKVVAAGGKSTDPANRLPGESASAANARITAGYKEMLAKPVLSETAKAAGANVEFVRTGAGGQGEYTVVTPVGYTGPKITSTDWTTGIIPATGKYTTGSTLGVMSTGQGTYTQVGGAAPSGISSTSGTSKVSGLSNKNVFQLLNNTLYYAGKPFTGDQGNKRYENGKLTATATRDENGNFIWKKVTSETATTDAGIPEPPVGTSPAYVYNETTGQWEQPPKPTTPGSWVWDNLKGWVNTTVNPGATGQTTEGGPTLAIDTFKNTLALFFGASEMSQSWVNALYKSVSGFYNTGSTIDEALNLSLQDIRNNPALKPFTDRFKGIYALQDRLAAGEAITVPTIAEYFKTESDMGDVLRATGLGSLATQDFMGQVLGLGKSLAEVTNLISDTFNAIDNAPAALKADLQTYFPGVDRTSLAKALLTGKEGWKELDQKVKSVSVMSAAKTQGVDISLATGADIAALGYDYGSSLDAFQKVKALERGQQLGQYAGIDFTQQEAIDATLRRNQAALAKVEQIKQAEAAKFAGSAGRLASRGRAQGLI